MKRPSLITHRHALTANRIASQMMIGCVLVSLPIIASAQVTATSEYLQRIDADADGRISLLEYQDWMTYAFDAMDANRDGNLSAEEQPGGKGKPVTREEHRLRLAERFKRQDLNRDGYLNAKELAAPPQ